MRFLFVLLSLLCVAPLALVALVVMVAPLRVWLARRFARTLEKKIERGEVNVFSFGSFPPPDMRGGPGRRDVPWNQSHRDPNVIDTTAEDVTEAPRALPSDRRDDE